MKDTDIDFRHEVALFRYSLIADLVQLPPGTKGLYRRLEEKARQERAEAEARASRAKDKEKKKGKTQETRYGRKELHVAGDKSGRRKRKSPRRRSVSISSDDGDHQPGHRSGYGYAGRRGTGPHAQAGIRHGRRRGSSRR